jgi:hypothetical protein
MLLAVGAIGAAASAAPRVSLARTTPARVDLSKITTVPRVAVVDSSTQDYSTQDGQFPGLAEDAFYLWAQVDTEDGRRYGLNRALTKSAAMSANLFEASPDIWRYPTRLIREAGISDLYWGEVVWLDNGDVSTLVPANQAVVAKHPISVVLSPERYVWKEEDVIDLVLTPLPRNVDVFSIPGPPDHAGYTSSGCAVSGAVNGSKIVGGYGGIDRMYAEPGLSTNLCKAAALEHYWLVWHSLMEDGSWQTGNVWLGEGNFATGVFNRPGKAPVIAVNDDVKNTVTWDSRGDMRHPVSAKLSFGGRTFDWNITHNATPAGARAVWAHYYGVVQEEGGPKPVKSWATLEVITMRAKPRG